MANIGSFYDALQKVKALIQSAENLINIGGQTPDQQAVTELTTACQLGSLLVPPGISTALNMAVDAAFDKQEENLCQDVPPSLVQSFDSAFSSFLESIQNNSIDFTDPQQKQLFEQAVSYASIGDLEPEISSADSALSIPAADGSTTTTGNNGALTITYTNSDPSQTWNTDTLSLSSQWQISSLNTENDNGTSEVTTYGTDGSSTSAYYSGSDGTGTVTEIDQENADGTSQITTYGTDGSSTSTYYSGPNGTGSATAIDQENADGTSQITTFGNDGSSTATSYDGPNGTGAVTEIDLNNINGSVSSQTVAFTYTYTGNEIYNSFNNDSPDGIITATVTLSDSFALTEITMTGLGQTLTAGGSSSADITQYSLGFTNGQVSQWRLELQGNGITLVSINDPPLDESDDGGEIASSTIPFNDGAEQNNPGTWSSAAAGSAVTISPLVGQTQSLSDALSNPAFAAQGTVQSVTIAGYGTVQLTGSTTIANVVVDSGGNLLLQNGLLATDPVTIDADGDISGFGTVTGDVTLNGTATAIGRTLDITGDVNGSGTLVIDGNAALLLEGTVAGTESLSFTGTDESLIIGTASSILPSISGFVAGDFIEIEGESVTAAAYSTVSDELTLTASSGTAFTLSLSGTYQPSDFVVSDGEVAMACFAAGTHILTPRGEVAVENLREGDLIITNSGQKSPIKWIGKRRLDLSRHPHPENAQPIRFDADCFADDVPTRDLFLSPDHALYIDGILVPAKAFINGKNIRQLAVPAVTYYHIELDEHSVIFAENTPAETYLETGNRGAFENCADAITLHPDFAQTEREAKGCAPFMESGPQVEAIRQRILERANIQTTADPALTVEYRNGGAIIQSRHAIPGLITPDPRDRRRLGVKVASIIVDGRHISFDHPALVEGWYDCEPDGRWTNGSAVIPAELLAGANDVSVILAATLPYPVAA